MRKWAHRKLTKKLLKTNERTKKNTKTHIVQRIETISEKRVLKENTIEVDLEKNNIITQNKTMCVRVHSAPMQKLKI